MNGVLEALIYSLLSKCAVMQTIMRVQHLNCGILGSGEGRSLKSLQVEEKEYLSAEKLAVFPSGVPMEYLRGGDRYAPGKCFQCEAVLFPPSQI